MSLRKILVVLCTLALCLTTAGPVLSCGPFLDYAVFSYELHPDFPLKRFASGELGIIPSTYARSYLVVAYRYLTNSALTTGEQQAVLSLWNHRLGYGSFQSDSPGVDSWLQTRKKVPGAKPIQSIDRYRSVSQSESPYNQYLNCQDSAFNTAADNLEKKLAQFETTSRVKDWLAAQDLVFCHCTSPAYDFRTQKYAPEPPFPQPLTSSADTESKDDRAYQIAAAHFYAQDFDQAFNEFRDIAASTTSRWKSLAPYLAARCLVRKATLGNDTDLASLSKAEEATQAILAGNIPRELKQAAQDLLSFIRFRLQPENRVLELAASVLQRTSGQTLQNDIYDFTLLLDNLIGDLSESDRAEAFKRTTGAMRANDLIDWISTYQAADGPRLQHAIERFETTKAMHWLIAALACSQAADSSTTRLLDQAQKLDPKSPAYLTAAYYQAKLLASSGKKPQARSIIDSILSRTDLPPSSRNLFVTQRLSLCRDFNEFLKFARQSPAGIDQGEQGPEMPGNLPALEKQQTYPRLSPLLNTATVQFLNQQVPLRLLKQMGLTTTRPDEAGAIFVRAVMLDDLKTASELAPVLIRRAKTLSPYIVSILAAKTPVQRNFLASAMMLRNPGLRPYLTPGLPRPTPMNRLDDYQDNWWCKGGLPPTYLEDPADKLGHRVSDSFSSCLKAQELAAGKQEYKRLSALGPGPTYLATKVLDGATKNPRDARVPEALARAIKSPRYSCTDSKSSPLSKEAFQLLHKNYPRNLWTLQSEYWY